MKILLVGDGEWRGRFENLARSLGVEKHFVFAGLVPPHEVARYVGIMDLLVHLSVREGLPRALPQALAAGKPVVAYDCGGAREICLQGETGCLLPPRDLTGLKTNLLALASNADLRRRLGDRGRELVKQWFPVERMVDDLYALYGRLMKERPSAPPP
jgi:glycosyltransferase involved in cell wall biosynthesis